MSYLTQTSPSSFLLVSINIFFYSRGPPFVSIELDLILHYKMASFLDLPPELRRRIYLQAGLRVREDIILKIKHGSQWGWWVTNKPVGYYMFTSNVLQTSRAIHDEVEDIIYAENRIIVNDIYGLSQLRRLPPRTCAKLTNLTVHLCISTRSTPKGVGYFDKVQTFALKPGSIAAWKAAAANVLAHANRKRLELRLICDTGDSAETTEALQPLLDHPGSVWRCHIRLDRIWDRRLCSLARGVALRAQGLQRDDEDKKPFRFMELPPEIRLQILEYTDLVMPLRQLEWRAGRGFSTSRTVPDICTAAGRRDLGEFLRFESCRPHHDVRSTSHVCSARQGGYSPFCQCWMPRGAEIMRVSRAMYTMAMDTLYRRNRIIVLPGQDMTALLDPDPDEDESGEWEEWELQLFHHRGSVFQARTARPPAPSGRQQQLGATTFLGAHHHTFQPAALSHLRTLEVVFPQLGHGRLDAALLRGWRDAVHHLREQGSPQCLTLIVHLRVASPWIQGVAGFASPWVQGGYGRAAFEQTLAEADPLQGHAALLAPLRELRHGGLRRLFVFLESGWHWSPPRGCTLQSHQGQQTGAIHDYVREMEERLERSVMGPEYDSSEEGKMKEHPSQWMLHLIDY